MEKPVQIRKITARLERLSLEDVSSIYNYISNLHPLIPINEESYEKGKADFLEETKEKSKETYRAYKRVICQFEESTKERKEKPWEMTSENIEIFFRNCNRKQVSQPVIKQTEAALSSFYRYLSGKYQIENPFDGKTGVNWLNPSPKTKNHEKPDIDPIFNKTSKPKKSNLTVASD